jgi:hypothetical protein
MSCTPALFNGGSMKLKSGEGLVRVHIMDFPGETPFIEEVSSCGELVPVDLAGEALIACHNLTRNLRRIRDALSAIYLWQRGVEDGIDMTQQGIKHDYES